MAIDLVTGVESQRTREVRRFGISGSTSNLDHWGRAAPLKTLPRHLIPVRVQYKKGKRQWLLSSCENGRLAFIYRLGWLPGPIRVACEKARAAAEQSLIVKIPQEDFLWVFRL